MGLFKLYFALCAVGLFYGKLILSDACEFQQRDGDLYQLVLFYFLFNSVNYDHI